MENPIPSGRTHLDLHELIEKANELIKVDWVGKHLSSQEVLTKCNKIGVQARQLRIGTKGVWQVDIAKDGLLVCYHDGNSATVDNEKVFNTTFQETTF
jgi:hypothetical protein